MGNNDFLETNKAWAREWDRRNQARVNRTNIPAEAGASTFAAADGTVPKVSGVTLVAQVQGLKVTWNDVNIRDLLRYDVQVSNNANFTGESDADHATEDYVETFRVRDNDKLLPALDPTVATYRARVRAINTAGRAGAWSNQSTGTVAGAVDTEDIQDAAVSSVSTASDTDTETLNNANGSSVDTDEVTVTDADVSTIIIIDITVSFDFASFWDASSSVNNADLILQRSVSGMGSWSDVQTITLDFKSTLPADIMGWGGGSPNDTASNVLAAGFSPDQPGSGSWDYRLRITTNTDAGGANSGELYISRTNADLEALVLKR